MVPTNYEIVAQVRLEKQHQEDPCASSFNLLGHRWQLQLFQTSFDRLFLLFNFLERSGSSLYPFSNLYLEDIQHTPYRIEDNTQELG
jgi:hypothetical protein